MKKLSILLCGLIALVSIQSYAATTCPVPSDLTYDEQKGWQVSDSGWQVNGSKYYHQSPKVMGLHNALWNGISNRATCVYQIKLKSGATPQVVLVSTQSYDQPSGGQWAVYPNLPKQYICPLNPAPLSVLDVNNCPLIME
jgi:hypothetical protein